MPLFSSGTPSPWQDARGLSFPGSNGPISFYRRPREGMGTDWWESQEKPHLSTLRERKSFQELGSVGNFLSSQAGGGKKGSLYRSHLKLPYGCSWPHVGEAGLPCLTQAVAAPCPSVSLGTEHLRSALEPNLRSVCPDTSPPVPDIPDLFLKRQFFCCIRHPCKDGPIGLPAPFLCIVLFT